MTGWDPAVLEIVSLLPGTGRGPRREGLYALWLTLRVSQDLLLEPPLPERACRRRLAALESRLSSLTVPPPLRRALVATLQQLKEEGRDAVPLILATLVAPVKETAGPEAAEALQRAARNARSVVSSRSG